MGQARELHAASDAAQLVELRVTMAQQTAELGRLRGDMSLLLGLPVQLDALSRLWQEQLTNAKEQQRRDMLAMQSDVDELKAWQTWAMRIVLGGVALAILALVVGSAPDAIPTPR